MRRHQSSFGSARTLLIASAALWAFTLPAVAQELKFDIPAEDASTAIQEFGHEANLQIVISAADARGKRTNAVRGVMTSRQALKQLLDGTGIEVSSDDGKAIVLAGRRQASDAKGSEPTPTSIETVEVTGSRVITNIANSPTPLT